MSTPRVDPAFPFYPSSWFNSIAVETMPPEVEGTYIRLLGRQWIAYQAGYEGLPIDPAVLQRLTKLTPAQWKKAWPLLAPLFPVQGAHRENPTLSAVWRERTEFIEQARTAGAKGGRPRKGLERVPFLDPSEKPPEIAENQKGSGTSVVCGLGTDTPSAAVAAAPPAAPERGAFPTALVLAGPPAVLEGFAPMLAELKAAALPHEALALDVLTHNLGGAHYAAVGEIHAIASGMHPIRSEKTGRPADAADVMRALADMAANGDRWNVNRFRGYVRRVVDRPPEPPTTAEREAARLARQVAEVAGRPVEEPDTPEAKAARAREREAAMAKFRADFRRQNPEAPAPAREVVAV